MTERFNAITVVLEQDMRSDDAEALLAAIRLMRGVASVSGNVTDLPAHVAETRARRELTDKLWAVLYPQDASRPDWRLG